MTSGLGVVTMFRDEGPYLAEWIEYHLLAGVRRFWLYDNGSTDDGAQVLAPYVARSVVTLTPWPTIDNPPTRPERIAKQLAAARDGFARASSEVAWVAHIDVDEFLLPMQDADVPACLDKHFVEASAVYVNWRMFGTSGVELPGGAPILPALKRCSRRDHPENRVGKSLVRPGAVDLEAIWYVHHFPLRSGFYVDGANNRLHFDAHNDLVKQDGHFDEYLRINHYNLRDERFFRTRRLPDAEAGRLDKKIDRLLRHQRDFDEDRDKQILRYLRHEHGAAYRARWEGR